MLPCRFSRMKFKFILYSLALIGCCERNNCQSNSNQSSVQGEMDALMKDTFKLLDILDQKLTNVNNRTASAMMKDNLRSLEALDTEYSQPVELLKQVDSIESNLRHNMNDDELVKLASSFSSDRRRKSPWTEVDDLSVAASSSSSSSSSSSKEDEVTSLAQPKEQQQVKKARQLSQEDTNLVLSENDSTERHIKFALNLMHAIYSNQVQPHKSSSPASLQQQANSLESFVVSPLSIQMILMMMHMAARGQTRRELANCLNLLTSSSDFKPSVSSASNAQSHPVDGKLRRRHQNSKPAAAATTSPARQPQQPSVPQVVPAQSQNSLAAHELFSGAMRNLLKDHVVMKALTSANQLFVQKNLAISSQYESAIRHYYNADLKQVDFQRQAGEQTGANSTENTNNVQSMINEWVERQTKGRISNFLSSPVPSSTLLMAINVLFFKGDWQYKFDPSDTQTDSWFTLANGKSAKVPMMVNKLPLAYAHDNQLKTSVIELPYKAQRLGLFILLPDDNSGIFSLMRSLNSTSFANLISSMRKPNQTSASFSGSSSLFSSTTPSSASTSSTSSTTASSGATGSSNANPDLGINVRIPKFSVESSPRLGQVLSQQLGLRSLFSADAADLSGMFSTQKAKLNATANQQQHPQVGLDELLHKAVLQVDEQGSVAAASSALALERVDNKAQNYFEADHPFLMFLMDKQTGLVLFSGIFAGPTSTANGSTGAPNGSSNSTASGANQQVAPGGQQH